MPDGRLPRPAVERMREMGAWLNRFGAAIYGTRPIAPCRFGDWAFTQGKDGTVYAIRMWGETTPATTVFIGRNELTQGAKALRHLVTGGLFPLRKIENPALGQYGVAFDLPECFCRDGYADAFIIEK